MFVRLVKRIVHKILLNDLRKKLKEPGGAYLDEHFTVVGAENIRFGESVYIGPNATLMAAGAPLAIKDISCPVRDLRLSPEIIGWISATSIWMK